MSHASLNVFQRLVRQWDGLHPYNAAQYAWLDTAALPADTAIAEAWRDAVEAMGIAAVSVIGRRYSYAHATRAPDAITVVDGSVTDYISREMNRPFSDSDCPLRPFIARGDDTTALGLTYRHWVADSCSIRMLMRRWLGRLFAVDDRPSAPRLHPPTYRSLFGPARAGWDLDTGLLSAARWSSKLKRVRRIEDAERFARLDVEFAPFDLPVGQLHRVRAAARRLGVTVNDIFLAGVAEACDAHVPVIKTFRRHDLALGTIVDLRPLSRSDLSETFGLFLGFTSVLLRPDDLASLRRLLHSVHHQTAHQKCNCVAQMSQLRMLAALAAGRILSPGALLRFYRKRVPLAGGISNVNLSRDWLARLHPTPLRRYVRVSPTGPMMPLVFTVTTLGDDLHFGMTRRTSLIDAAAAEAAAATFIGTVERVCQLAAAANPPVNAAPTGT